MITKFAWTFFSLSVGIPGHDPTFSKEKTSDKIIDMH